MSQEDAHPPVSPSRVSRVHDERGLPPSTTTQKQVSDALVAHNRRRESNFPQQPQPNCPREQAMGLAFVHGPYDPLFVTEQDSEINQDRCVAWVRISGPLHVTQAAVVAVVTAMVRTWNEGFA